MGGLILKKYIIEHIFLYTIRCDVIPSNRAMTSSLSSQIYFCYAYVFLCLLFFYVYRKGKTSN